MKAAGIILIPHFSNLLTNGKRMNESISAKASGIRIPFAKTKNAISHHIKQFLKG
jgi:hypothetical protein